MIEDDIIDLVESVYECSDIIDRIHQDTVRARYIELRDQYIEKLHSYDDYWDHNKELESICRII